MCLPGNRSREHAGGKAIMARFTRRNTPPCAESFEWLVLIGENCQEYWVWMRIPDESIVRKRLHVNPDTPVLIGRP